MTEAGGSRDVHATPVQWPGTHTAATERRAENATSGDAPARIREATPREIEGWDDLVERFENHRVTHRRAWIESLEALGFGRPLYLVFEKVGDIVGCLPGLLGRVGLWRSFGSPLPGWQTVSMGPVFDRRRLSTRELTGQLLPYLERHHGVSYVELMTSELDGDAMCALGFRGEQVFTYRAPLHPGDEARTLAAFKDSARRNVRRALRLGLVVRFEDSEDFVDEHYDQLREVYVRGGNVVPFGKRRMLECFRRMRSTGHLLAVSVYSAEGANVATGTFLMNHKELLLWMWAHRTRYRWLRPTELMTWTVMQRALAAGCETFDLMGRGVFKEKFGATLDPSKYRWVWSRPKWLTPLRFWAERGYRWQQAVRGRLARLAASAAGACGALKA